MSEKNEPTIFKKIIDGEIPADIVYQDDLCLAFHDVSPQAPIHVLLIPKKEIVNVAGFSPDDAQLAGHLMMTVDKVAKLLDIENGYRVVANCGAHLHILAGRQLAWPPG